MEHETNHQTSHHLRRIPKSERRVRFADSMGMELVSIFLFDLISNYYLVSYHNNKHKQLPAPPPPPTSSLAPSSRSSIPTHQNSSLASSTPPSSQHSNHNATALSHNNSKQQSQLCSNLSPKSRLSVNNNEYAYTNYNQYQQNSSNRDVNRSAGFGNQQQQLQHNQQQQQQQQQRNYHCEFTQPISLISFKERVKMNKVHLETCNVNLRSGIMSVSCTIRVLNLSFAKSVLVRYTTDEWHTFNDSLANYMPGSCDGWSDKFTTTFRIVDQSNSNVLSNIRRRIVFAVKYSAGESNVFWDNNGGLNYSIKLV